MIIMGRITAICGIASCLLLTAGLLLISQAIQERAEWMTASGVVRVCLAVLLLLISLVLTDICSKKPSDSHTVKSLLKQYTTMKTLSLLGYIEQKKFLEGNKNIKETQDKILAGILKNCGDTDYSRRYNLGLIESREDLVRIHPITDFKHYEHFVERVCAGEKNVMVKQSVEFIGMSSGTTGKFKRFPLFAGYKEDFVGRRVHVTASLYAKVNSLGRILNLAYKPKEMTSKAGIQMGAGSHFLRPKLTFSIVPNGAAVSDQQTQNYIMALFALAEDDLQYIDGLLAPLCWNFFRLITDRGEDLCHDLENGCLSGMIKVEEGVRKEINRKLRVGVNRASQVRKELRKGSEGLALRLWPNLKLVHIATTGTFASAYRTLKSSYLKGVHCRRMMHVSSEAQIGFPPECHIDSEENPRTFVFAHSSAFFEFIPEDEMDSPSPKTFFLDQLQVGQTYEVLLTTRNGLYRYRLGDVIKVVGFLHENPIYEFQYRAGQLLNIKTEKTSENVFYAALRAAELEWTGVSIVDYTSTESTNVELLPDVEWQNDSKKRYLLFLELRNQTTENTPCFIREDQQRLVDQKLREMSRVYDTYRANGSIACMEVVQVKPGTFSNMKAIVIKETNNQQYKTARANRRPELLTLLLGSRIADPNIGQH